MPCLEFAEKNKTPPEKTRWNEKVRSESYVRNEKLAHQQCITFSSQKVKPNPDEGEGEPKPQGGGIWSSNED